MYSLAQEALRNIYLSLCVQTEKAHFEMAGSQSSLSLRELCPRRPDLELHVATTASLFLIAGVCCFHQRRDLKLIFRPKATRLRSKVRLPL